MGQWRIGPPVDSFAWHTQGRISQLVYKLMIHNLQKHTLLCIKDNIPMWSQICSCQDSLGKQSWCVKVWHYWILGIKFRGKLIFTWFHQWAHKPLEQIKSNFFIAIQIMYVWQNSTSITAVPMKINHLFNAKVISKYGQQKAWEARGAYGSRINLC